MKIPAMLKLKVLQAEHGDCFILEYGTPSDPKYILIDGGPEGTYNNHLKEELRTIRDSGGKLRLAILSHVDNDHVIGLLDMIAELRQQRTNNETETITVESLWHNSFSKTIGSNTDIEPRMRLLSTTPDTSLKTRTIAGMALKGISEGHRLRLAASALGIPVNRESPSGFISVEEMPARYILGGLSLRVVGPTKENIEALQREWLDLLKTQEQGDETVDPFFESMSDDSFKNLSSITVLVRAEGKSILFTGDARGDHLIQGLSKSGLLSADGRLHVDMLKVPHHGSDRNVTKSFFRTIAADTYILSGNGKYGNPDLSTLIWIVEAAKEQGRTIKIVSTNDTPSTRKLREEYSPCDYGYALEYMNSGDHSITVEPTRKS